jgi:predicted RNase H-like HicB family nuclease
MITRKYSLVVEGDESGYNAYIPELPTILVTGRSMKELTDRACEAVKVYWEFLESERSPS